MSGRAEQAEPWMRRAVELAEASAGRNSPAVAIALGNLADLLAGLGRLDEALRFSQRSLAIRREVYGDTHLEYASALEAHSNVLRALHRDDEMLSRLEQAWQIRSTVEGPPDALARVASALARELWARGQTKRAVQLARDAAQGYAAAGPGFTTQRAEVQAWLSSRASSRRDPRPRPTTR
jgi:tetratricopeptide (TPR) repeat protein